MNAAPPCRRAGFTLIEMLVAMAASAMLMASIVASSVALQRSFFWSADYSEQSVAQLRALDFVTRDVRGARSVTILASGEVLALELPDVYPTYDAQGNPTGAPLTPAIIRGQPVYGSPTDALFITYYRDGDSLIRQQFRSATAQNSELVIARGIRSFQSQLLGGGNLVRSSVTFQPRLRDDAESEARTSMSAIAAARTMIMKYDESTGGGGAP